MAANNAYAAYQKFALNPQANPKREESPNTSIPTTKSITATSAVKANQYLENKIMTASPQELTMMLYNGAIMFMNKAVAYIDENNISKAHEAIVRAEDIFEELINTLNMDYDISEHLYPLYEFIISNLVQANMAKDKTLLNDSITLTRELRDTWAEAMKIAKKETK